MKYSFTKLLFELASDYGAGITFIDVDETIFHTFAKVGVRDSMTGKLVRKLDNMQFNSYKLPKAYYYDFSEFNDAKLFKDTSIPIVPTIKRIKRMFKNIDKRESKIVFLTARADFDDNKAFLDTFSKYGIPINKIDIQLVGNYKTGTIPENKKKVILAHLATGKYRRVRLFDDYMGNIRAFLDIQKNLPKQVVDKVKKNYHIQGDENIDLIEFYGLLVKPDGSLKRVK